jgi:hypothetical protein
VADKTIPVLKDGGRTIPLEEHLKAMAQRLGLPFQEVPLR